MNNLYMYGINTTLIGLIYSMLVFGVRAIRLQLPKIHDKKEKSRRNHQLEIFFILSAFITLRLFTWFYMLSFEGMLGSHFLMIDSLSVVALLGSFIKYLRIGK